jgi:hypothetical protein
MGHCAGFVGTPCHKEQDKWEKCKTWHRAGLTFVRESLAVNFLLICAWSQCMLPGCACPCSRKPVWLLHFYHYQLIPGFPFLCHLLKRCILVDATLCDFYQNSYTKMVSYFFFKKTQALTILFHMNTHHPTPISDSKR